MKIKDISIGVLIIVLILMGLLLYPSRSTQSIVGHDKEVTSMDGGVTSTVTFENDRVRVVRYHFAPHAKIPTHQAPNLVAVYLTDAQLQLTFPDGKSEVEKRKVGDTIWLPAQQHAGEN